MTLTLKVTVPLWEAFMPPVSVHWTVPAEPTPGCVVTEQAVTPVGSGAPHPAAWKVVYAGVESLITILESGPLLSLMNVIV